MEETISRGPNKGELKNAAWIEKAEDEFGAKIISESKMRKMLP